MIDAILGGAGGGGPMPGMPMDPMMGAPMGAPMGLPDPMMMGGDKLGMIAGMFPAVVEQIGQTHAMAGMAEDEILQALLSAYEALVMPPAPMMEGAPPDAMSGPMPPQMAAPGGMPY